MVEKHTKVWFVAKIPPRQSSRQRNTRSLEPYSPNLVRNDFLSRAEGRHKATMLNVGLMRSAEDTKGHHLILLP